MDKSNKRYQIKTSEGYKNFSGIRIVPKTEQYSLFLENGFLLVCTPDHKLFTNEGWKETQYINSQNIILTDSGFIKLSKIIKENIKEKFFYDIIDVENDEYVTNGIISHNCSFVGSENTLISATKLASMPFVSPFYTSEDGSLKLYEAPQRNHIYTMCVDTSRGEGMDYHAFTIVDTTTVPYRVVGVYRNNKISPSLYPSIITKTATQYNEAYVMIELNDLGQLVAEIVYGEMEYGNLILVSHRGKRGQNADGGFASGGAAKVAPGVKMSYQIKNVGCSVLKDMVELDKIQIPDFDMISELSTFVKKGAGYEATPGYYDDTVICLVMFGWLTTQSYFKDYTNTDIRQRLFEEKMRQIEDNVLPFGFINNGVDDYDEDDGYDLNNVKKTPLERKKDELNLWDD